MILWRHVSLTNPIYLKTKHDRLGDLFSMYVLCCLLNTVFLMNTLTLMTDNQIHFSWVFRFRIVCSLSVWAAPMQFSVNLRMKLRFRWWAGFPSLTIFYILFLVFECVTLLSISPHLPQASSVCSEKVCYSCSGLVEHNSGVNLQPLTYSYHWELLETMWALQVLPMPFFMNMSIVIQSDRLAHIECGVWMIVFGGNEPCFQHRKENAFLERNFPTNMLNNFCNGL